MRPWTTPLVLLLLCVLAVCLACATCKLTVPACQSARRERARAGHQAPGSYLAGLMQKSSCRGLLDEEARQVDGMAQHLCCLPHASWLSLSLCALAVHAQSTPSLALNPVPTAPCMQEEKEFNFKLSPANVGALT